MNRHINSLIFFIGLLGLVHFDIAGFYFLNKWFNIRKYTKLSIIIIKLITIVFSCLIIFISQYSRIFEMPFIVVVNVLFGVLVIYALRYITVKSEYFYFRLDEEFFEFWNKNIRGK